MKTFNSKSAYQESKNFNEIAFLDSAKIEWGKSNCKEELTFDIAKKLRGKLIATYSEGYAEQDTFMIFTVGEMLSEWDYSKFIVEPDGRTKQERLSSYFDNDQKEKAKQHIMLFTEDENPTYIFGLDKIDNRLFCGDVDRIVYFKEISVDEKSNILSL